MRVIGSLLLLVASSIAHDAVFFSSTTKITKDSPALEALVASATSESPLVFFVNPDFVLGQFSKAAAAYSTQKSSSSIVNGAKSAKWAESRFVGSTVHVPSASLVSGSSSLQKGQAIYLVSADNWSSLDQLAAEVLSLLGEKATVIVTNSDVVSTDAARVKRVALGEGDTATDALFPIVLPKEGTERQSCLFYLEGLNFVTKDGNKYHHARIRDIGDAGSGKKWGGEATCSDKLATKEGGDQTAEFSFTINPGTPTAPTLKMDDGWTSMSPIGMKLTFTSTTTGYWSLTKAELTQDLSVTFSGYSEVRVPLGEVAKSKSLDYLGLNSVFSYSWNCWDSQALFFGDAPKQIGISFHGIQVQVYGKNFKDNKNTEMAYFNSKVDSCTGTFSVGSWMGIITALVLMAVFIFGFLMLNSVQTLDRYDDPKQRQILINVRE